MYVDRLKNELNIEDLKITPRVLVIGEAVRGTTCFVRISSSRERLLAFLGRTKFTFLFISLDFAVISVQAVLVFFPIHLFSSYL